MRNAARSVVTLRHTYNLVELPIKVAGKSGTAEFGTRDSKGRLPFSSGSSGSCRRTRATARSTRPTRSSWSSAFAYDSRTIGNVATEIVKYYLQLHFGIKKDYRLPQLLKRGNFYQSNDGRSMTEERDHGRDRARAARVSDWAAKSVGAAWRAFDLQLTTYAGLLRRDRSRDGLHEQRRGGSRSALGRDDLEPRPHVGARSPSSCSSSRPPSTITGSRRLAWPIYGLQLGLLVLTLAIGDGVGGIGAVGIGRPDHASSSARSRRS
jgi:hypothetical protein